MWIFLSLYLFIVLLWVLEYIELERSREKINIRIHVNGTRGKSSTTRLISAVLRASGMKSWAKVTGTEPMLVFEDGSHIRIPRRGRANIIEQAKILKGASKRKIEAIVMECMALRPDFQWIEAHKMIKPTIAVITNVRADHLDVMGPTVEDVALALSNTIPKDAILVTAEKNYIQIFEEVARKLNTKVYLVDGERDVKDEEMRGFPYIEHKDNVAIALKIAELLGVDRRKALEFMYTTEPDPGVLYIYEVEEGGKKFYFVSAFAANDPDSFKIIWDMMKKRWKRKIVVMNCRDDRVERSKQLGELLAKYMEAEKVLVTGALTKVFISTAVHHGFPREKIIDLEGLTPLEAYERIKEEAPPESLVFGMGNMVTFGERLTEIIKERAKRIVS